MKPRPRFMQATPVVPLPIKGSNTTPAGLTLACVEIRPDYFEIACQRIDNAQRQERLFA